MSKTTIPSGGLADSAVATAKIADNAVVTGKITDGTIATADIAGDAITEAKIADDAVESEHLNDNIISGQTELASEPADTDEFLVSDAGTLKRIDYSLIKGGGITEADQFRLTTSFTGEADPISSNLERVDTANFAKIGTGVSVSSGRFSFASTGIYLITAHAMFSEINNDSSPSHHAFIRTYTTTNNSSYTLAAEASSDFSSNFGSFYDSCSSAFIFDVENTSTHK